MSMGRRTRLGFMLSIFAAVAVVAGVGWAKDQPDGTVSLETRDLGAGLVGWTWGHGVLSYKGERHPFKVDGLVLDTVGAEREDATGGVYHLGKLADFEGTYRAIEASAAAGKKGVGVTKLRNDKGVEMRLRSVSKGFGATAGPEGVKVTLEH
jgi:hypothetical protein